MRLSGQLIAAFQGQGATISSFLTQTAALTNTLADRDQLIGQVIDNLNTVLGSLGDQSDQFDKAVDSLSELVERTGRAQEGHQQRGGIRQRGRRLDRRPAVPGPPAAAEASCTRPIAPQASSWPTTTTSTTSSTRCPTSTGCSAGRACTATTSASTCATSVLKINGKGGQPVYIKVAGQDHGTVRAEMKTFSERNPLVIGAVGVGA